MTNWTKQPDQQEREVCPLGGQHDTRGDMVDVAGYSCIKCHKTWDREWRPNGPKLPAPGEYNG